MNYEELSYDDLKKLSKREYDKITFSIVRKILCEHIIQLGKKNRTLIDDSNLYFHDPKNEHMQEVISFNSKYKIYIYLYKKNEYYDEISKDYATHVLEQILNHDGNIISETIKRL